VTRALGSALEKAGCDVEYLGFEHVFRRWAARPGMAPAGVGHSIRFPWLVAHRLAADARRFDIVDASLGDAWVWASLGRPGARRPLGLVARSHGLEHVTDKAVRAAARTGGLPLSRKYPIYHGGYRLWEVSKSLRLSDRCILLNQAERAWAADRLGVPRERLVLIPNAIDETFHRAAPAKPVGEGPVRLAFVGSWIPRKGTSTLVEVLEQLATDGIPFRLSILGCGDAAAARADLPRALADRISIVPAYRGNELPSLLADHELLLFPSRSEGSSLALVEAMACGLAPLATRVGAAPDLITPDHDGVLVDVGDATTIAAHVTRLAGDRAALTRMRLAAQETARRYRWDEIAARTLRAYEQALASRSRSLWCSSPAG
jgi:glycosyltransferase involved in cell wall biosynthesis